jgi:hypothetical protein
LSNPATVGAIITIVSVVTGYSTEEKAFGHLGGSDEDISL